jgi:cytochrome c
VSRSAGPLLLAGALLVGWPVGAWADATRGERVFQRCYACHSVTAGEKDLPGPSLRGVFGRRAGSLRGFQFSPAMINAGRSRPLIWTRKTLDGFLADPQHLVPGTSMGPYSLRIAEDRRDVIDYLVQASRSGPSGPGKDR